MAIEMPRAGPRVLRAAALRLPRDRPQQVRRRAVPAHGARSSSSRSTRSPKARPCSTAPTASRRRSASRPAAAGCSAIDATCPLVTKVHLEAVKYAREGYTIVLIGHEGHDEVIGTMGEAPDQMVLVETAEDVERLEVADPEQGRLSDPDDAERRRRQRRHRRPPEEVPADRQPAQGRHLLRHAEPPGGGARAGGAGRRGARAGQPEQLEQQAAGGDRPRRWASPSHLIDGVSEIRPDWFEGVETVLITAGASAPEDVVQECIEYLETQLRRDAWRRLTSGKRTSTSRCPSRSASCSPPGAAEARAAQRSSRRAA